MGKPRGCPGPALLLRSVGVARRGQASVPPTAHTASLAPRPAGAAWAGWVLVHPGVGHVWVGMVMRTFAQPSCVSDASSLYWLQPPCALRHIHGPYLEFPPPQVIFYLFGFPRSLLFPTPLLAGFCGDFASVSSNWNACAFLVEVNETIGICLPSHTDLPHQRFHLRE